MVFAPRALINYAAFRHNLHRVREAAPHSRVWAVIKANGYGHGLLRAAEGLEEADGFAVARLGEGLALREAGVDKPILLLEGVFTVEDLESAVAQRFQPVVHQRQQLELLETFTTVRPLNVWVKVDTGMHRLGFAAEEVGEVVQRLESSPAVAGKVALMTHLANADDRSDAMTLRQCEVLRALEAVQERPVSIGNSGGVLGWPEARGDWVRPGIMLYGASPFSDATAGADEGLRPVMTLQAPLIAIHQCHQGDAVGYGGTYCCPETMPVGVVGIGYGDGYPRHAREGTPVRIGDQEVPLIGRVSMDMITVDLRGVSWASVGDWATLWGEGLPVERIAALSDTIAYELLCNVAARVEFQERRG